MCMGLEHKTTRRLAKDGVGTGSCLKIQKTRIQLQIHSKNKNQVGFRVQDNIWGEGAVRRVRANGSKEKWCKGRLRDSESHWD